MWPINVAHIAFEISLLFLKGIVKFSEQPSTILR